VTPQHVTVHNGRRRRGRGGGGGHNHLPFLHIDIYRKTDSSLGHRVYGKPTHTNLYI